MPVDQDQTRITPLCIQSVIVSPDFVGTPIRDMSESQHSKLLHRGIAIGLLVLALLVAWFAYAPGISGGLHFDDPSNLGGLAQVQDRDSALRFIVSGDAGPLGRPLALATFVPQAAAWPDRPDVFLRTNILIHLFNAILVSGFLYLLGLARGSADREAAYASVGGATVWMLMPILASSSLFIVQRMTTVSATFVLLGAIGYLLARPLASRRPILALLLMSVCLGLGATLAALAKESGALLFVFVLVIEVTLLTRPTGITRPLWRAWFTLALLLPMALLAWYLLSLLPYPEYIVLRRGFTGFERLVTQAEILWRYLYLAFLPSPPALGPYHDDYRLLTSLSQPAALVSVLAWIMVMTVAVLARRRAPLFTFAVAWFLGGHLIESTTVSLELYYEHRNYLPLIGPAYALVAGALGLSREWRPKVAAILGVYCLLLAGLLFSVTSLSGNQVLAAEMWHIYKPDSLRAALRLAKQNELNGDPWTSLRVLRSYLEQNPDATSVGIAILQLSCQVEDNADHKAMARQLVDELRFATFTHANFSGLAELYEVILNGRCEQLDVQDIYEIAASLLDNPRYNPAIVRNNLHLLMARIKMARGELGSTMHHVGEALAIYPDVNTLSLAVSILNSAGRQDLSLELLQEAEALRPRHPVRASQWDQQLELLTSNSSQEEP